MKGDSDKKALRAHVLFLYFIKKGRYELADRAVRMKAYYFEKEERNLCPWLYD